MTMTTTTMATRRRRRNDDDDNTGELLVREPPPVSLSSLCEPSIPHLSLRLTPIQPCGTGKRTTLPIRKEKQKRKLKRTDRPSPYSFPPPVLPILLVRPPWLVVGVRPMLPPLLTCTSGPPFPILFGDAPLVGFGRPFPACFLTRWLIVLPRNPDCMLVASRGGLHSCRVVDVVSAYACMGMMSGGVV